MPRGEWKMFFFMPNKAGRDAVVSRMARLQARAGGQPVVHVVGI